jgi:hypothetical protein
VRALVCSDLDLDRVSASHLSTCSGRQLSQVFLRLPLGTNSSDSGYVSVQEFSRVPETSARTQLVIGFGTDGSNGRPTSSVKVSMAGLLVPLTHRCDSIFGLTAVIICQSESVGIYYMAVDVQGFLYVISVLATILL